MDWCGVSLQLERNIFILSKYSNNSFNIRLLFRKRGKGKTGHSLNGSVLGYNTDPAGEKLLPPNGTLNR